MKRFGKWISNSPASSPFTISSAASSGSMSAGMRKSFCAVIGVLTKPGFTTHTPMPFGCRSR